MPPALSFTAFPLPATVSRSPLAQLEACVFAIPSRRSPSLVTQLLFKNAPDVIARQFVAKLDITRHRKIGDPVRAPRAHLRLGHLAFAIQNDRGFHIVLGAFGPDRVACDIDDIGVAAKRPFEFEARNILAASPQIILLAFDKIEIAVFVYRADVPAVEPEILHDPKGDRKSTRLNSSH